MDLEVVNELYGYAIKEDWEGMIEFFDKNDEQLQIFPFSVSRDTALHLATHCRDEKTFRRLYHKIVPQEITISRFDTLDAISMEEDSSFYKEMLPQLQNAYGNTVLHEAVIANNLTAVKVLVQEIEILAEIKNYSGETPLYIAASLGHTKIVDFLAKRNGAKDSNNQLSYDHRRRITDGTPILHITLEGQHFETVLKLLKIDESLGDMKDDQGITALQLLAKIPKAFRSGYSMNAFAKLIYSFLPVEEEEEEQKKSHHDEDDKEEENPASQLLQSDIESGHDIDNSKIQIAKENHQATPNSVPTHWISKFIFKAIWMPLQLICKLISEGWPVIESIWNEKKKHSMSLRIARLLAKKDLSWIEDLISDQGEDQTNISHPSNNEETANALNVSVQGKSLMNLSFDSRHQKKEKNVANEAASSPPHDAEQQQEQTGTLSFDLKAQVSKIQVKQKDNKRAEIPLFTATSNGIIEIVEAILEEFPQAIEFINHKDQNILHVAVMHRRMDIFDFIQSKSIPLVKMKYKIDVNGYTLLHQVADMTNYPGGVESEPILKLQEELKWFEKVEKIVPSFYQMHEDCQSNKTPWNYFKETHDQQLQAAEKWIKAISQSCSTVASLLATVVFAAAYAVPGGFNPDGFPNFLHKRFFLVFTIMDVLALASSLTSVVLFLSILTSPFQYEDFRFSLPRRLTLGFILLFFSEFTTMLAFGFTTLLLIKSKGSLTTSLISVAAFLPVSVFAMLQLRLCVAFAGIVKEFLGEVFGPLARLCSLCKIKKDRDLNA